MRLGVVTTSYPREPGDPAGSFVAGFARFVASRGHDVEVVAAGPGTTRLDGIRVTRVDGRGLFYDEGAADRLERDPAAWRRAPGFLARLVAALPRGRRWDRVASHWLLPSGLAAATLGLPHLAVAHSADVHLAARPLIADAVVAAVTRRGRIAFVAEHLRARLAAACLLGKRLLSERSLIQPMGIDPPPPAATPGDAIVFLGRLVPIKGPDVLVEAARDVPHPTILAGDGPLAAELRARAPASVTLAGELRGPARDALYARAAVVVVPSRDAASGRTEGAPTVVVEALAAGIPVVASELPATRPLAAALRLVPPGDPAALAAAIRETLAGGPAVRARVARGRAVAAERSWAVAGQRLLDAWLAI